MKIYCITVDNVIMFNNCNIAMRQAIMICLHIYTHRCFGRYTIVRAFLSPILLLQHIACLNTFSYRILYIYIYIYIYICFEVHNFTCDHEDVHCNANACYSLRGISERCGTSGTEWNTIRLDAQCFRVLPGVVTNENRMRTHGAINSNNHTK